MNDGVTLITMTGGRPEAFALCEKWMSRQNYVGPLQWVVVDDVDPATETHMGQEVVRPAHRWAPGIKPTVALNFRAGLLKAEYDVVIVVEDDDWYSPFYVKTMYRRVILFPRKLVGECPSKYYNVSTRQYWKLCNRQHASLCQTAFHRSLIAEILNSFSGETPYLDLELWKAIGGKLFSHAKNQDVDVVGIKGLPGRPGAGMGHRPGGTPDESLSVLKEWVGYDWKEYEKYGLPDR